jgi:hypothetical protein
MKDVRGYFDWGGILKEEGMAILMKEVNANSMRGNAGFISWMGCIYSAGGFIKHKC